MFESYTNAARTFQYDYIYIDAIFLSIWILLLIRYKKWSALKAGFLFGICVYIIDAVIWWNSPAGPNYPTGTYIREYWIGGVQMPHPLGNYFWVKFGADFMMTISYSIFAFAWLWIAFENIEKKNYKELAIFTSFYFGAWILTPFLSLWIPLNDSMVVTVRHMDTQLIAWIINVIAGYAVLFLIYGTNKFNSKNIKIVYLVFIIGCMQSFFIEFPLFISGIRPTGIEYLLFEVLFLFNQGAPYLFIMWDIIIPLLKQKIFKKVE